MIHSFPIQLLFHLIRKNPFLIAIWLFFVTLCTGGIGRVYGIHYLFLDPEYLNQVNFISFFWVGMALGNFIMSFHISSYILLGHYFPFVGILERPFAKFSLNNSLLPVAGLLVYFVAIMHFHWGNENKWLYIMGLGLGIMLMVLLMMLYFHWTNRDIFLFLTGSVDKVLRKNTISRNRLMNKYKESKENKFEVNHYLDLKLRIRSCSDLQVFYDKKAILKVFDQNHFNSVAFELAIISLVFVFGFFIENP
ncbi:MAG: patatin-like phospholipase family protein, partial [Cyclobacteriaceae bacterium]|nr:patatin-like phospholipase family protein [Cyclobacteriaceae bacterium]